MTSELWELHMDTTRVYMSTEVAVPYMSKVLASSRAQSLLGSEGGDAREGL